MEAAQTHTTAARQRAESQPRLSLAQLARIELDHRDGDTEAATEALIGRLTESPSLLRSVIEDVVRDAVVCRVESALRSTRAGIINAATKQPNPERQKAAAEAHVRGIAASLLDLPLANGVLLRDATREQILAQAERYEATGKTLLHRGRFLRLVAEAVPGRKKAGQVLTDERALAIWEEAHHG